MFYTHKNSRDDEWIKISHALASKYDTKIYTELNLSYRMQCLGNLDCFLANEEEWYKDSLERDKIESIMRYNRLSYLSFLWVLDAYELFRILKSPKIPYSQEANSEIKDLIKDTYDIFHNARIPLIKYQSPGKNESLKQIAFPIISKDEGYIGWYLDFDQDPFFRTPEAFSASSALSKLLN